VPRHMLHQWGEHQLSRMHRNLSGKI
jgi:hypothetical protein